MASYTVSMNAQKVIAAPKFMGAGHKQLKAVNAPRAVAKRNLQVQAIFKKKAPPAPVKAAAPPKGTFAQSFELTVPGALFQAKNDIRVPISLGFTKGNELFVGRLAMLGFAFATIGEVLTGKGALAQFDIETGLPLADTEPLILGLVAFNVFVAFAGALGLSSGKFKADPRTEAEARESFDPRKSLARPREFFGITKFGFSKENELFVGRVAQLGFAAALIGEAVTGVGPLAQFGLETGIPLSESEPALLGFVALMATLAINEGTGSFEEEEA